MPDRPAAENDNLTLFFAHRATKIVGVLAVLLGLTALVFIAMTVYSTGELPRGAAVPSLLNTALVLWLLLSKRPRAAVSLFLWGLAVIPVVSAMLHGGLTAPVLFLLPVATMASSWLMGKRQGALVLVAVCAGLAVIAALHVNGQVSSWQLGSPVAVAGAMIGMVLTAAALGHFTSKSFREQFIQSQELGKSLALQVQEIKKTEDKLRALVYMDETTGLRSAHGQRERIDALTHHKTPFALMCLNLDSFRLINDNFGPSFGNSIICAAAGVISQAVGQAGELARAEGAEFTVVVVNVEDKELLRDLSNRILMSLRQPLNKGEVDIYSDISIGISRFPIDATDPDELFRMAQVALHEAKELGGRGMCGYEPYMNQLAQENLWLDHHLRTAIDMQQLQLFYQPKMLLDGNRVAGVEALLRWIHPSRGNIRPDQFIPRAEVAGAIVPIGRWIIATAAQQAATWFEKGQNIRIAINVSAKQLSDNELLAHLSHAQTVAHGLLDVELTESCLADNEKETLTFIEKCRSMGFGVHLDDFGTGYSSLARLAQLPLTMIKLDRAFVAPIGTSEKADALVRAMVSICKELDLAMIAEGVETQAQASYLMSLGVSFAQGWLYAPAMAIEKFDQWLTDFDGKGD